MRRCLAGLLLALTACEPPLPDPWPPVAPEENDAGVTRVRVVADGAGFLATVNATDTRLWVGLDLDAASEASFEPPAWDLAFNRFHVRARGGASGDGGVMVAILKDVTFEAVTVAPVDGYLEDLPDGPDDNTDLDTVFEVPEPWYMYELSTHILTPQPWVYVVKSDQQATFKVRLDGYYDGAGTPAVLSVRFARLSD